MDAHEDTPIGWTVRDMALSTQAYVDPSVVRLAVLDHDGVKLFQVVIVTALAYDAIVTMDKEIQYFWVFLSIFCTGTRYIGILGFIASLVGYSYGLSSPFAAVYIKFRCKFSMWTSYFAYWTTLVAVNYILMLRVLALYSQDKTMTICLKTILIAAAAFELGLIIYIIRLGHPKVMLLAGSITFCSFNSYVPALSGVCAWSLPALYGIILSVLALYKALKYRKRPRGSRASMLVTVLLRDQAVFFVLVILCSLLNIASIVFRGSVVSGIFENPSLFSLLGSRMIFNLKEAAERGQQEGTDYRTPSRTVNEIEFAELGSTQRDVASATIPCETAEAAVSHSPDPPTFSCSILKG